MTGRGPRWARDGATVDDLAGQLVEIEDNVMASPEFEAHVYRLFP
mgnify:CR=1 FL=1